MRYENSVTIRRPIEDVFAYMTTIEYVPTWQHAVLEARRTSSGAVGVGSTYIARARVMGREFEGAGEIIAWSPPSGYTVRSTGGPLALTVRIALTREAEHTRVEAVSEGEARGVLRFAAIGLEAVLRRQAQHDLETLKMILERGSSTPPTAR